MSMPGNCAVSQFHKAVMCVAWAVHRHSAPKKEANWEHPCSDLADADICLYHQKIADICQRAMAYSVMMLLGPARDCRISAPMRVLIVRSITYMYDKNPSSFCPTFTWVAMMNATKSAPTCAVPLYQQGNGGGRNLTCMRCSRLSTKGRKWAKAVTPSMRMTSIMVSWKYASKAVAKI